MLLSGCRLLLFTLLVLFVACSTTSNLSEGEVLYTGIKKTTVYDEKDTEAEGEALTEVEAALAYAPNGSFMGSSSVRTPFPIGLWVYNSLVNRENKPFSKWMLNTFGSPPVTIDVVNPATRTKVATNLLQNYGYFNGYVDYELVNQRNPKKQKIKYDIHLGEPYLYDEIRYMFMGEQGRLRRENDEKSYLKVGGQFSVPLLQAEKERLSSLFRNNGFYYYRPDYIRYFADSMQVKNRVKLLVSSDIDMPDRANRQFYIGNIHTYIRHSPQTNNRRGANSRVSAREGNGQPANRDVTGRSDTTGLNTTNGTSVPSLSSQGKGSDGQGRSVRSGYSRMMVYDDSIQLNGLRYVWQGEKEPVKPRVLFKNYRFRRQELFDQSKIDQTVTNLSNMQVFQQVRFTFTPRDTTIYCDTLDVRVDAVMDKLVDAEFDFSFTQKSNSQVGPKAGLRVSKRNAFGHGETFSVGLKGSYEWQTDSKNVERMGNTRPDSWEAGLDASLTYPWLAFPGLANKFFRYSASSVFRLSIDNLKRAGYYRLISFGADATYNIKETRFVSHQISPLILTYNQLMQTSARFDSITANNSALYASMRDQFIPSMQYIFTYDNSADNTRRWTTRFVGLLKESGNLISGVNSLLGNAWDKVDKKLLGTPYSQFFKIQFELSNKWQLKEKSCIATRLQVGSIFTYGNSRFAPYSELYYVGGANSIRAFGVRTIGPGRYYDRTGRGTYLDQAGDFKLEANVEYRFPLVSNLNAAIFIDAGNVWNLRKEDAHPDGKLGEDGFFKSVALGTGFGFRYDLQFLVLRLDFGIGIHAPYDTGKSGYYNIPKFSDGLGIHFAVGYPF